MQNDLKTQRRQFRTVIFFGGLVLAVGMLLVNETTSAQRQVIPSRVKQPVAQGVLIDTVPPGSPAADAGPRPGMILEKVGDSAVATPADVAAAKANWANPAGVLLLARSSRGGRFLIVGGDS